MKKFLKFIIILIIIVLIAAAVAAGMFYKKATPSLIVDLDKKGESSKTVCSQMFKPEFTDEKTLKENSSFMTCGFWTSKWCLDMDKTSLKSIHYDLSGYNFKDYLKALKDFNFGGFRGVASMNQSQSEINILCTGAKKDSKVTLYDFGKTKLRGKTLEIIVEEAVYKGNNGETVLPVVLRDYTAGAGDKLEIKLDGIDEKSVCHIKIIEANKLEAPAYENKNIPKSYKLSKDMSADINVKEDGEYTADCIFNDSGSQSYFEIYVDGKSAGSAATFVTKDSSCVSCIVDLKKGKHKVSIVSEEELPEFEEIIISPSQDSNEVYLMGEDGDPSKYIAVAPAQGEYNITSTELRGNITVNSQIVEVNDIGAASVILNKGYNEISFGKELPSGLKIIRTGNE